MIEEKDGSAMEETDSHTGACPWENRSEVGLVKAYRVTLKEVLLNTRAFVEGVPGPDTYWGPVWFAIMSLVIGFLGTQLWAEVKDWAIADVRHPSGLRMQMIVLDMKLLPVLCRAASTALVLSLLQVLACHLTLKRLCGEYRGLAATWPIFFYSLGATEVLYVVPFVGSAFAGVWRPIVPAVGLAAVHRTEMRNAVAGVLVIAAIGTFFTTAVSVLGLALNMGPSLRWGDVGRFVLGTL
ncbi:MAG: hypothetical protein V1792_08605 [Pseudomonadota bacterium]